MLALLLFATMLSASDWPQFRGPNANGISLEKGIDKNWNQKPPKELWRVPMSDDGFAGPCAAGGRVFIIDHIGKADIVRAIDVATGKDVWRYTYEDRDGANFGYLACHANSRGRQGLHAGPVRYAELP